MGRTEAILEGIIARNFPERVRAVGLRASIRVAIRIS